MTIIKLPDPDKIGDVTLESAILQRRSVRDFSPRSLTLEQIGQLLWSSQGITGVGNHKRSAPSAGACHPLTFYACWEKGVWRYQPEDHSLLCHLEEDVRVRLPGAALDQDFLAEAGCVFVISAIFERTTVRYGDRGQSRYVSMDVGHTAENLLLQAVALGLGSVPVGAFQDEDIAEVLSLPDHEEPIYILPVGNPK
jgi:SagB-type dehydrogenase family enzyme